MGIVNYEIFKKKNKDLSAKEAREIMNNTKSFKWKRVSNLFNVKKLDSCLSSAMYYGFYVTPYQYYGTNVAGMPIVINAGMAGHDCIKVFTRQQGMWVSEFIPFEYLEKLLPAELVDELNKSREDEELCEKYL